MRCPFGVGLRVAPGDAPPTPPSPAAPGAATGSVREYPFESVTSPETGSESFTRPLAQRVIHRLPSRRADERHVTYLAAGDLERAEVEARVGASLFEPLLRHHDRDAGVARDLSEQPAKLLAACHPLHRPAGVEDEARAIQPVRDQEVVVAVRHVRRQCQLLQAAIA